MGIEPKTIDTGIEMSEKILQKMDSLVDMVIKELNSIGIKFEPKAKM